MQGITLEDIRKAKAARQGGISPEAAPAASSAPPGITLEDITKAKYTKNNDALASMKNPSNEEKWLNLMSGGDALAPEEGKLDTAQQIGLGVVSGVNSAAERVAKITAGANTLMTAGANKVISGLGGPEDFLQTPELNKVIDKPFEATKQSIDEYTQDGKRLSDVFGINTVNTGKFIGDIAPSFVLPGAQVAKAASFGGKVLNAGIAGAKAGAIYGGSEAATSDNAGEILGSAAVGGTVGAVLGSATQATMSVLIGIGKYIGNKFIPAVKEGSELTQGLLNQFGGKKSIEEASKYNKDLYNIIDENALAPPSSPASSKYNVRDNLATTGKAIMARSQQEADEASDLFQQAFQKELQPYEHLKRIRENKALDDTIKRYDTQLMNDFNPESTNAARYRDLVTETKGGVPNPDYKPNGVERYKIIKEEMGKSINTLQSQKGGKVLSRDLVDQQKALLDILDEVSPEYRAGRAVSQLSKIEKEALTNAGMDRLAGKPNEAYAGLKNLITSPDTDPRDLRLIRDAYLRKNPEVWKSAVGQVFETALNKQKPKGPAQPLDFMKAVMPDKAHQNLIYEVADFRNAAPGTVAKNDNLLIKLKALSKIKEEMDTPTFTSMVKKSIINNIPIVRGLQGSDANHFNKNAIKLLKGGHFDPEFDSIIRNKALDDSQKVDAVIELLLPKSNIGPVQQGMNKLFTVKPAEIAGSFYAPKEDNK